MLRQKSEIMFILSQQSNNLKCLEKEPNSLHVETKAHLVFGVITMLVVMKCA